MDFEERDPTADIWPDPEEATDDPYVAPEDDPTSDEYIPAYARQGPMPVLNPHLPAMKPRTTKRSPLLDELAERERSKPRRHRSNLVV